MQRKLFLLILIIFLSSSVMAYRSDNFIRNLSQIIYSDCGPANFDGNVIASPNDYFQILKNIDQKIGTGSMCVGCSIEQIEPILWCQSTVGKHELKFINDKYYWDNVEVESPSANCPTCPKIECPTCPELDLNKLPSLGVNMICSGGGCQQSNLPGTYYGNVSVNKFDFNLFLFFELAIIGISLAMGIIAEAKFELWDKLRKPKKKP